MMRPGHRAGRGGLLAATLLLGSSPLFAQAEPEPCQAQVVLRDRTASSGLLRYTTTFGHAVADVDNDGDEDLLVSNHGALPSLYLNQDGRFLDHSDLLPFTKPRDRHGVTLVDLDNDGDRDLLVAGGGGGRAAVTSGLENQVARNLLIETGELRFELEPEAKHRISYQSWRGRHLLPMPSRDGRRVDLHFLVKTREGKNNRYLRSLGRGISYASQSIPGLNGLASEGYDVPLDFNRDGRIDVLLMREERPRLMANRGSHFERVETPFDDLTKVTTAAAGDLDRDGYPEIYLGTHAPITISDQLVAASNEVHFVTFAQEAGDSDALTFLTDSDEIKVNFQFLRGLNQDITHNVFIGRQGTHPDSRQTTISVVQARGKPQFAGPGIYFWNQPGTSRWNLEIHYAEAGDSEVGTFQAPSIQLVRTDTLERFAVGPARDRIYRNLAGAGFEELDAVGLEHRKVTRSVSMVDLDNNGWLDIAVLRGAPWGAENGTSVVLANCGQLNFGRRSLPNHGSRIYSANNLTFGFLDNDTLPDLFLTNGWGPAPSNKGPHRLLLNRTPPAGDAIVLEIVGRQSNRDGIGAQVELLGEAGQLLGYRLLAYRGLAQDSQRLHFGLGDYTGRVWARIHWPGGSKQTSRPLIRNQLERVRQPLAAAIR